MARLQRPSDGFVDRVVIAAHVAGAGNVAQRRCEQRRVVLLHYRLKISGNVFLCLQKAEQRALEEKRETIRHLLAFDVLSNEQIADATGLAVEEIAKLRIEDKHNPKITSLCA